jgi:hypothetical protein
MADGESLNLLPYFYEYYGGLIHGIINWPNGEATLRQPLKLRKVFELWYNFESHKEKEK